MFPGGATFGEATAGGEPPSVATDGAGGWMIGAWRRIDTPVVKGINDYIVSTDDAVSWTAPAPMKTTLLEENDGAVALANDGVGNWVGIWPTPVSGLWTHLDMRVTRAFFSPLPQPADLRLAVAVTPNPAWFACDMLHRVTVTNAGPGIANDVMLTDIYPAIGRLKSATATQGQVTVAPDRVVADLGALAPGASAKLDVTVVPGQLAVAVNNAAVSAANDDPATADNVVVTRTRVVPSPMAELVGLWRAIKQECRIRNRVVLCTLKGSLRVYDVGSRPSGPLAVRIYLSDTTTTGPSSLVLQDYRISQIRPGKSVDLNLNKTLPPSQCGSGRYIIAVVDPLGTVVEANRDNNVAVFGPLP